jgi:enterobacteria phage integrase
LLKRIPNLDPLRDSIELDRSGSDSRREGYKSTEIHTWNEGEISIFERRWSEGTRERLNLSFALLLYTGQRGSDVYRMTWADIVKMALPRER